MCGNMAKKELDNKMKLKIKILGGKSYVKIAAIGK